MHEILSQRDLREWRQAGSLQGGVFDGSPANEALVFWHGDRIGSHSVNGINRAICTSLLLRGQRIVTDKNVSVTAFSNVLQQQGSEVHVQHLWPPRFSAPTSGHWVVMLPWEFSSLPREWVSVFADAVDEVWVYSTWSRRGCIQSGLPSDRVKVIPLGVDQSRFRIGLPAYHLTTRRGFKFLFCGRDSTTDGFDILINAYFSIFSEADDVCLVIKDESLDCNCERQVAALRSSRIGAPEIEFVRPPVTDDALPMIYSACDCLVQPYRSECFGLSIAEAMACGLPVIVTAHGPALDFCDEDNSFLLPASLEAMIETQIRGFKTVDRPWIANPDSAALAGLLQGAVANREKGRELGKKASSRIRTAYTWERTASLVQAQIRALAVMPVRRFTKGDGRSLPQIRSKRSEFPMNTSVAVAQKAVRERTPSRVTRTGVSLCMIVRNEADKLAKCMKSVAHLVDEIIVVDTGSDDGTREIAESCGARVFEFAWSDSFAAARNASLDHANHDWIFWLDADEYIDEDNAKKLQGLFQRLPQAKVAYVMRQYSAAGDVAASAAAVEQVRLFRNAADVRWEYRVHEQILLPLRRAGHEVCWTDVTITHDGYREEKLSDNKLARNLRLLRLEESERPHDPITLYHLGLALSQAGHSEEALAYLQRSLERTPSDFSTRPKTYAMISRCNQKLRRPEAALIACQSGLREYPEEIELLFHEALLLYEQGDLRGAEKTLLKLLHVPVVPRFSAGDPGLRGHKARHLLGSIYLRQGRMIDAESQWRAAVDERPDFIIAWQSLAELYQGQGRTDEGNDAILRVRGVGLPT